MSLFERVPPIDLSPEFVDAPLNPGRWRDYFALLHNLLYFPQRVRAYVGDFARNQRSESSAPRTWSRVAWAEWLRSNPVQTNLFVMVMVVCAALLLVVTHGVGVVAAWSTGQTLLFGAMGLGLATGIVVTLIALVVGVIGGESGALAGFALPIGNAIALTLIAFDVAVQHDAGSTSAGLLLLGGTAALFWGMASSTYCATASASLNGVRLQVLISVAIAAVLTVTLAYGGRDTAEATFGGIVWLFGATLAGALLGALRPDDYALGRGGPAREPAPEEWLRIPRVTPIPLVHLHEHLTTWFDHDWQQALDNAATIWLHTAQQHAVHRALHEVMAGDRAGRLPPTAAGKPARAAKSKARADKPAAAKTPTVTPAAGAGSSSQPNAESAKDAADRANEWVVEMVSRVVANPAAYPWEMIAWSESSRPALGWQRLRSEQGQHARASSAALRRVQRRRIRRQRLLQQGPAVFLPQDTPERALAAAFWYLEHGYLAEAITAFEKATPSPLTREVQSLLAALNTLSGEENLVTASALTLPDRPKEVKRKESWDTLDTVRSILRHGKVARHSLSAQRRGLAMAECAALVESIRALPSSPYAEARHLQRLAAEWQADLAEWEITASTALPLKPVPNPFIFAEPLRRQQVFVGRERELAVIKLAWTAGNLQPVLLYGLPQSGKTSLLYAAEAANSHVSLAWLNLGSARTATTTLEQALAALRATVRQASVLELAALQPPVTASARPYAGAASGSATAAPAQGDEGLLESERVVRQVCAIMAPRNLILVLDDFDSVPGLLQGGDEITRFVALLEHLCETVTNFNIVVVTHRPPTLFTGRFGRRFLAAATMHPVGQLQRKEVAKLLRPTNIDLYMSQAAVERTWQLTAGHPYLVQLLGHGVVQRFNRAAITGTGEPFILPEDVDACVGEEEFAQRSDAFFARVLEIVRSAGGDEAAMQPIAESSGIAGSELWQRWAVKAVPQ